MIRAFETTKDESRSAGVTFDLENADDDDLLLEDDERAEATGDAEEMQTQHAIKSTTGKP